MATFTDRRGQAWEVELTAGDLKRIKRQAGVDLRDALKPGETDFTRALDDPERFLEVMWLLCGRAATVPRDEFEALFDRDTTVGAVAAVWESVWDFSRGQKAGAEARRTLLAAVDQVEAGTVEILERATALVRSGRTSTDSVRDSAESSALTIDPSPLPS
jgi:hypothetical protein